MDAPAPQIEKKPKVTLLPIEASKKLAPADVSSIAQQLVANVEKVIVGKHESGGAGDGGLAGGRAFAD